MSEREKIIAETSWATKKITDLLDQLEEGMPIKEYRSICRQVQDLQDVVFYNQEYLYSLENRG